MIVYVLSFLVLVLVVTGMAVGVIFSNKPIKGSCGGLSAVGIDGECEICGGDPQKCDEEQERREKEESETIKEDLAYDATQTKKQ
ncbi:(Na+)-NQR maturation NqrM [Teredinibacter haidensis]|uniref:(Na+)-NQR maturation NqrM n=1 Tax=Teredinibacter haidensis TaxID=2731755 RepID=UPI0009489FEC|nr:(Na+)-NQR maturation NqrM [Teredinibacter haidensis]